MAENTNRKIHRAIRATGSALILLLIILTIGAPFAGAVTVQFSDQNVVAGQVFLRYDVTEYGAIANGTVNTTDQIWIADGSNVLLVLKPSTIDYIHNPLALFDLFKNSAGGWILLIALFIVSAMGAVVVIGAVARVMKR